MKQWDEIEMGYINRQGWNVNDEGLLVLTAAQARNAPHIGKSIRNSEQRTLMLPGLHGCTLIFEGVHFIIK